MRKKNWVKIGTFGVDSGQVLITDPCYLDDWKAEDYDGVQIEAMQKSGQFAYSYNGACAMTSSPKGAGSIGGGVDGVVSNTGYGDGEYSVYAHYENGRVMELRIKFD